MAAVVSAELQVQRYESRVAMLSGEPVAYRCVPPIDLLHPAIASYAQLLEQLLKMGSSRGRSTLLSRYFDLAHRPPSRYPMIPTLKVIPTSTRRV